MIRRGIGVQSFVSAGGGTDADAQAVITAIESTGVTLTATQKTACNTLVTDLKGYGIWSKMKAVYGFLGGTGGAHKWNWKDPRDLDAAFRLVFSGGWTFSNTGALPNGVNAYADTKLNPSLNLSISSAHISKYNRNNDLVSDKTDGVAQTISGPTYFFQQNYSAGFAGIGDLSSLISYTPTDTRGLILTSRTSSNSIRTFRNTNLLGNNSNTITFIPSASIFLGARNNGTGIGQAFNSYECAFASIGDGLTDTEAANLYTAVQAYQTTLGRSVGTQTVSDSDAQAFVNAAVIEDQVQATAINTLVTDLKGYGIWSKMKAIYPFVGGTSSTHKWNLKDPRDLDAAFRLVFSGGITHSSTGALFNGTNGYSNTFLTPSANLTNNSTHLSFYSRTNFNGSPGGDIGTSGASPSFLPIALIYTRAADFFQSSIYDYDSAKRVSTSNTNSTGFYVGNRTSNVVLNSWKNGVKQATNTTAETQNITTVTNPFFVGAINLGGSAGQYSNKECAFASIGDGLTDTEAANLYTAVQAYQTSLSRNV